MKTWMESVREGHKPEGNPPGFRPCLHCGLPLLYMQMVDPIAPRWEFRTPVFGDVHDCEELRQRLEDHDAEHAVNEEG